MATGHLEPGYMDTVSRYARANNAMYMGAMRPAAKSFKEMQMIKADPVTLEEIRKRARRVWLDKDRNETTYQDHFKERFSAMDEATRTRPTSPNRHNLPHPSEIFLTTRLHYCPGYHNPDTQMNKPQYRVDGSDHNTENRARLRAKFAPTVSKAATDQYRSNMPQEIEAIEDPVEKQTAQAMYKATTPNEQIVLLDKLREQQQQQIQHMRGAAGTERPVTVPSAYRYNKEAGAQERQELERMHKMYDKCASSATVRSRRMEDIDNTLKYAHRSKRGDFLMHPQWPPTILHHRLNGLSALDRPHLSGRR